MPVERPESLILALKSLAEFILMVCGIAGIAVQIFHAQGLLTQVLDRLIDGALMASMSVIVLGILAFVLAKRWHKQLFSTTKNTHALGDFLMRAMMLTGAYFLYLYISTGSFKI